MSEPKNHHYLPVFYLKQWARPDGLLTQYSRPYRKVVADPKAPASVGYKPSLYALEGYAADQRNTIEKNFMAPVVDDPAAQALHVLIEHDNSKLTPELRQAWTRFVMSLHVRHPAGVEQITQQAAHSLRQSLLANPEEYDAVRGADDPPTLLEWVDQNVPVVLDNYGKLLLPGIITHEDIGNAIIHMRWWTVGITQDFPDMLTCDRPLYLSQGVADERCFIALPLSPRFIFVATRNPATFDNVMAHGIEAVTKSLNEILVTQADKYVYGAHDRHLRFVENRLRRSEAVAV